MRKLRAAVARKLILRLALLVILMPVSARLYIHWMARDRIVEKVGDVPQTRVCLVLGASVRNDGSLSEMLRDRVDKAIQLYRAKKVQKLLMSGDNRTVDYNEPRKMRNYALKQGVPEKDIVMDFAGRRTYDSVYRAKNIFGQQRLIIVTQRFHLDRALFLARRTGIDAYGVPADSKTNWKAKLREGPACIGALVDVYFLHPQPVMGRKETI